MKKGEVRPLRLIGTILLALSRRCRLPYPYDFPGGASPAGPYLPKPDRPSVGLAPY